MKKIICIICFMGALTVFGQDCKRFLFFQKGKTIGMTIYNSTGEVNGKQVYQVLDVTNEGGTTTGDLNTEIFDKTGRSFAKTRCIVKCNGGVMIVDMRMIVPQQSPSSGNAEAKINNEFLEFPANLHVGDQLRDGSFTMNMSIPNMQETGLVKITERKVVGQETVTTAAGSWSCFKITSKSTITMNMAGRSMPPMVTESAEWYAPGVGIIKTQSPHGSTAITSIN